MRGGDEGECAAHRGGTGAAGPACAAFLRRLPAPLRARCAGPRAADSASDGRGGPAAGGLKRPAIRPAQRIRTGHAGGGHGRR